MESYKRLMREYPTISFRYTHGKIDVFPEKQFHRHYELYLLLDGAAEFISDHGRHPLSHYQLVVIPPNEYHRFLVEDTTNYRRCVLALDPDFLGDDVLATALQEKEILSLTPDHRIVQQFLYLTEQLGAQSEEDFRFVLSAAATDIAFLIKQHADTTAQPAQGFRHSLSPAVMEFVNRHYKRPLSLQDIADEFYLSVSAVSHLFKEDFGVSIKKYITEKQMNEIRRRLQQGGKPQELSQEFGFSNYSTFYRSYFRYFGTAPSAKKR